jgi:hypothetical protein
VKSCNTPTEKKQLLDSVTSLDTDNRLVTYKQWLVSQGEGGEGSPMYQVGTNQERGKIDRRGTVV